MLNDKDKIGDSLHSLRAENAALRVALRQALEFCVGKEKKAIEYIFHLGQFKSRILNRVGDWILSLSGSRDLADVDSLLGNEPSAEKNYQEWVRDHDFFYKKNFEKTLVHISQFSEIKKFTIVIDYNASASLSLAESLKSISRQFYENWEVILCCQKDHQAIVGETVDAIGGLSAKLKILIKPERTSFKELSARLASEATGDYVAFLDAGARLHEAMLYEVAAELDLFPNAGVVYADEDVISPEGRRVNPCFKPDWNLELYLAQNYIGDFCFLTRDIFQRASAELKDKEDVEALTFRALTNSKVENIRHIPTILYHRLLIAEDICWSHRTSDLTKEYFIKHGIVAEVSKIPSHPEWIEVRRGLPVSEPLVTIIIPTRNRPDLLSVCLRGVLNETSYKNIEVIIVDHENNHPEVLNIFRSYLNDERIVIMPYSGEFDHSDMNNRAALIARGEILLFLNDDIEVFEPGWLQHLVAQFIHDDRGVVGAKLLYPSRRIQHAGVILGFGGVAGHGHVGLGAEDAGYFGRLVVASEVSALTGACMAIKRELFEEIGGFSARHLQRTFNDVDLCLKAHKKGKINIFTPLATLIHHESATDGGDVKLKHYKRLQREVAYMLETWGLMRADPYYNVNLTLEGRSFELAVNSRRVAPFEAAGL